MTNTTSHEDRLASACKVFGGTAADLADAMERLDQLISKRDDYISELENRIGELENRIGELEYEIEQLKA